MSRLPLTGTAEYLAVLDPFVPDQFINERWSMRPTRGPRWRFSAAQLWRVHLLALLTPAHSMNLLVALLPEQPAWRAFACLRRLGGIGNLPSALPKWVSRLFPGYSGS